MKVLAIDPGYDRLGVAVLTREAGKEVLIFSGCISSDKKASFPDRLLSIGEAFSALLLEHVPDTVALETLFFNKNITTALAVAETRGMLTFLAKKHGCVLYEYSPQEIKVALTGYGKSDKSAMISMVKRLIKNAPEKALDDEYDAIATGITCLAHHGQNR